MPVRQQQDNISISDFLFAFSRLMRWAIDNPLQAMVAMLAFQAVLTTARRESPQAKDIGLEMDEILEPLAANAIDLETRDLTQSFVVQDVSAYSQRNLQQGQSCQLAYNYADGFALSFGGSNSDQAQTVAVLSDGSIVVAGSSNSFAGNNNFDGFIVKFFTNGTMIWAKSFGAVSTDDNIRAMIVKPDGKILVAGDTSSYGAGYSDILLAQFSTEGGLEWVKAYGKTEAEYAYSLAYSPLDKVLVTGYTSSFGAGGNGDILVAQFSANGAFEWAKAFGTTSAEFGKAIAVRSDGKMLVSGDANNQVFVMQLSSAGALEWSQSFGSTSEETHRAMTVGSDNKVQVLSQTNGYVSGGGALLLQLTSAGALDWAKVLSKAGGGSMGALYLRSNGSIVLSGAVNTGSNCLNMAQFSTSGAYEWGKILTAKSGTSTESAAIAVSPEGRLIVAGRESGIVDSTGNMLLLSLNSNNGLFALGSNGAWSDWVPTITSVNPGLASFTLSTASSTLTTTDLNNMPISNAYNSTQTSFMSFRVNSVAGEELIAPLNYAYYYPLYPNGPFKGITQTPTISVDLSQAAWLKYDFINQVLYGTPLFNSQGNYFVQFSASGVGANNVGNLYGIVQMSICVKNYDYRVPSYFTYPLNPYLTAPFNQPYQFNFTELLRPNAAVTSVTGRDAQAMPSWLTYNSTHHLLQGLPSGTIRGNYLVDVSFQSGVLTDMVTLVVNVPNTAPRYVGPTNSTVNIGRSNLDFSLRFVDDESDPVSFGIGRVNNQPAPSFISMEPLSGRMGVNSISGDQGDYYINVTSTDSYNALGWSVISIQIQNRDPERTQLLAPPVITTVGSPVIYSFPRDLYQDLDGDSVSYQTLYPAFLSYDASSRTFYGTPLTAHRGLHELTIIAKDAYNGAANVTVILDINGIPVQQITLNSLTTTPIGLPYSFTLPAGLHTDPDGDVLDYQLTEDIQHIKPSWLGFNSTTKMLSGTPNYNTHQAMPVRFTVSDDRGGAVIYDVVLSVPNSAPRVNAGMSNQLISVGQAKTAVIPSTAFSEVDGDSLSYRIEQADSSSAPEWITIAGTAMNFAPRSGAQGNYSIRLVANDGYGAEANTTFTVSVRNQSPIQAEALPAVPIVTTGNPFTYSFGNTVFRDPDGDELSYSAQAPSFLSLNSNSRTLSGTPQASDRGIHQVILFASDPYAGQTNATIQININGIPAQQITLNSLTTTPVGLPYSFSLPAGLHTDPDGDAISYELIEDIQHIKPSWLNFNSTTRTLSGTPNANTHQAMPIRFSISDGRGGVMIYDVALSTPNTAPRVDSGLSNHIISIGQVKTVIVPSSAFNDADQDGLSYRLEPATGINMPEWISLAGNAMSFAPRSGAQGNYSLRLIANDGHGLEANTTFSVSVPNVAPEQIEPLALAPVVTVGNLFNYGFSNTAFKDADGDSLAYSAQAPGFLSLNANTRTLSGIPSASDRGIHQVILYASDPYSGRANATIQIVVNGNPSRQISLSSLMTTPVGLPYSFVLPAGLHTDPDGDAISYELTEDIQHIKPNWLSFNSTTRTLFGTPNANSHQSMPIRFTVSDGRGGQTIYDVSLSIPNSAPQVNAGLSNQVIAVGQVKTVVVPSSAFIDADQDNFNYRLESANAANLPDWISLAGAAINFAPRSGAQGNYSIRLLTNDGYGAEANTTFAVTVLNQSPVQAEALPAVPGVTTGNPFVYSFGNTVFRDPDGDTLSYGAQAPGFLVLNSNTRTLSGLPGAIDRGVHQVKLFAIDPYGAQANATLTVTVNGIPVQQMGLSSLTTTPVGLPYSFSLPVGLHSDPDSDVLDYQLTEDVQHIKPSWLSFNSSTRTLSGTPNSNSHQAMPIRFTVSDNRGGVMIYDVSLNTPNSAPQASNLANQTISVDTVRSLLIPVNTFVDVDGDRLSYSLAPVSGQAQNWISIANDVISFFPKSGDQGTYQFKLTARDDYAGEASIIFAATVPNRAPTRVYPIPAPSNAKATEQWSFALDADNFEDADRDPLQFSATKADNSALPNWISFNPVRRSFSGTPRGSDRGIIPVQVKVQDDFGGVAAGYFNVTVVNSAPQAESRIFDQQVSQTEDSFTFTVPNFLDPDTDAVSYAAEMLDGSEVPDWLEFNAITRTFSVSPNDAEPGNYLINIVAMDALGLSQKVAFNLAIQAVPVINTNSKEELLKQLAPVFGGGGLLMVIAGLLMARQKRIHSTNDRILTWSQEMRKRSREGISDVVEFASLRRDIKAIGKQLSTGKHDNVETNLKQFAKHLRLYYTQSGKHEPMTSLLDIHIVENLIQFAERNIVEPSSKHYDAKRALRSAKLLHEFFAIILSEHTGQGYKLLAETKAKYFAKINSLIDRLQVKTHEEVEALFELHSAREILICIADTNTLWLLCLASATHILSPANLLMDMKTLAFNIPSRWYIKLLELNAQIEQAKTNIEVLTAIQSVAKVNSNWHLRFGMINLLLDILIHSPDPVIRTQAIMGTDSRCGQSLLGLKQLLQKKNGCYSGQTEKWIRQQARQALGQVYEDLSSTDKQLLVQIGENVTLPLYRRVLAANKPLRHVPAEAPEKVSQWGGGEGVSNNVGAWSNNPLNVANSRVSAGEARVEDKPVQVRPSMSRRVLDLKVNSHAVV